MKKFILGATVILLTVQGFSQQTKTPAQSHDRAFYLEKHRKQNTTAWVFFFGGIVTAGIGVAIGASNICLTCPSNSGDAAGTVAIVGGIITAASIPFFISAASNKKKARALSTSLILESNQFLAPYGYAKKAFPAISFVIKL